MHNISEASKTWYAQESDKILNKDINLRLKQQVEQDLLAEYDSVLAKANWFQTIGLNFKLQGLKQERLKLAIQNYLDSHQHPETSNESLW